MAAFDVLQQRGFIKQTSNPSIPSILTQTQVVAYSGFDPTGDSLHLGHLLPALALRHLKDASHTVIGLVGGATGMVGDPSGKSKDRVLLDSETISHNARKLKEQLTRLLGGGPRVLILDNYDWVSRLSAIELLRDIGRHFRVGEMIRKDSVSSRLEVSGISYTEFSYMVLQAYDFWYLFKHHGCTLQCGGSDQWGNITAGIDLVRKMESGTVYGITYPLVTDTNGKAFGKSNEDGTTIWLSAERTSPFEFYQYLVRTADQDVERYLKLFTFLDLGEIEAICKQHTEKPEERLAQKRLAGEVTELVHGPAERRAAEEATQQLYESKTRDIAQVLGDVPSTTLEHQRLGDGVLVVDMLIETGLTKGRNEGRRLIRNGGVYLDDERVIDTDEVVTAEDLGSEAMLVLRVGKKKRHVVRFE